MFNFISKFFKEDKTIKPSFNIGGRFVTENEFYKYNRPKKQELIGVVRTDCDNDIILGEDGYFDSMRKVLKKFNTEKVKVTIEIVE